MSYTLWLPARPASAGVVVLHGAGSRKENHHDVARAARAAGMTAIVADLRGHGDSDGAMDAGALDDVATLAGILREHADVPIVLRGSSMGGWLAICGAEIARAAAVIAICPATSEGLASGLRAGRFAMRADLEACEHLLAEHDPLLVVEHSAVPLMLLHAAGDETVPVEHSRELARRSVAPETRLVVVEGGHHRSVQHDPELQGESLRWARRAVA